MSFKQFSYNECLPGQLSPTWDFLEIKKDTVLSEVALLRFITGTLDIRCNLTKKIIKQRCKYSKSGHSINSIIGPDNFKDFFVENNTRRSKAKKYYTDCRKRGNLGFFDNLLSELSNFSYQKSKGAHTTAFLHLYRVVELISYTFPLYFASSATSYTNTYTELKKFFSGSNSELGFFKTFVNEHLFKGDFLLDFDVTISIKTIDQELSNSFFYVLKRACEIANITIKSENTIDFSIIIANKDLIELTITLRNRYFHQKTGDGVGNFTSSEFPESDTFFEKINDLIMNWIALIYVEIIIKTMNK